MDTTEENIGKVARAAIEKMMRPGADARSGGQKLIGEPKCASPPPVQQVAQVSPRNWVQVQKTNRPLGQSVSSSPSLVIRKGSYIPCNQERIVRMSDDKKGMSPFAISVLAGGIGLVAIVLNQLFWVYHARNKEAYNNTDAGKMELAIEQTKADTRLAKVTGVVPHQSVGSGSNGGGSVGQVEQNVATIVPIPPFDCSTIPKRDEGFRTEPVHTLNQSGTTYTLIPGCARIQVMNPTKFKGGEYLLRQQDASSPTGLMGCGTIEGLHNSPSDCLRFLKQREGQVVEVIIKSQDIIIN